MSHLSLDIEEMRDHYAVVVVGSGYGASVAASRMARAGQAVCVLERGREVRPGEYPNTFHAGAAEVQVHASDLHTGSRTALMDFHVHGDMNVLVGCGLGGTSLINANVSLQADPRIFDDPRWPRELVDDLDGPLAEGFRRAEEMLKPTPYPEDAPALRKLEALKKSAESRGLPFYRPPINVTFEDGVNHVGVEQKACNLCGDCVTGCNHWAKNTTLMNYLPDARNHGAEIFSRVCVRYLERRDDEWVVHFQPLHTGWEAADAPLRSVRADIVMLGGGSVGTTEVLLRSKAKGLPLSDDVGMHFFGNADVQAFGYNGNDEVNAIAVGPHDPASMPPVGPCITGIIDDRDQPDANKGIVVEEGALPGALAPILPEIFAAAVAMGGTSQEDTIVGQAEEMLREAGSFVEGAYHGALQRTITYLVMSHDATEGRMTLKNDRLQVKWPGIGKQPVFQRINDLLMELNKVHGGEFVKDPIWTKYLNDSLITVHPLGGSSMAVDAEHGVVNHRGQAFSGTRGDAVYDSLYVCDGAQMPRSLGVNPLLTISAMAERICALAAAERGWTISYELPSRLPSAVDATAG